MVLTCDDGEIDDDEADDKDDYGHAYNDDDDDILQSTLVQRRAGQAEVLTVEIVILLCEEPDVARVRPKARQCHLQKHLTIIVINIALGGV